MLLRLRGGWADTGLRRFSVDGHEGRLTEREAGLLAHLLRHLGAAQSREVLLREVFGYHPDVKTRALDLAVFRLRKKIERDPSEPVHLQTVPQVGYRLVLDERSRPPLGIDLVEKALASRTDTTRDAWAALDSAQQRDLAILSLFWAPVAATTLEEAFGVALLGRVRMLAEQGVLGIAGEVFTMGRSLRAHARAHLTGDDRLAFGAWALRRAREALDLDGVEPQDLLVHHARELLEVAETLPAADAAAIEAAVLRHLPLVSRRKLERLESRSAGQEPVVRAYALRALLRHQLASPEALCAWAEELEGLYDHLPPVDRAIAALTTANHHRHRGRRDVWRTHAELASTIGDLAPGVAAQAWLHLASTLRDQEREAAFDRALGFARRAGATTLAALALGGLATSAPTATEETLSLVRLALDLIPSDADRMTHNIVLTNLAAVALLCDPDEAAPICSEAVSRARSGARPVLLASALLTRSDLDRIRDEPELALRHLDEASRLLEGTRKWHDAQLRRAATLAELGEETRALEILEALPSSHLDRHVVLRLAARAELALRRGADGDAAALVREIRDRGLAQNVQEQADLCVLASRGHWPPVSTRT